MKTLVLVSSKYGASENCGKLIKNKLNGSVDVVNLKNQKPDLKQYETVIIGGGIYAGNIQSDLKKYVNDFEDTLIKKNIGLFLCCKEGMKNFDLYINHNIPTSIVDKAFIKEYFGYEISLEKMGFVIRTMMKTIFKVKKNEYALDLKAIDRLASITNNLGSR